MKYLLNGTSLNFLSESVNNSKWQQLDLVLE